MKPNYHPTLHNWRQLFNYDWTKTQIGPTSEGGREWTREYRCYHFLSITEGILYSCSLVPTNFPTKTIPQYWKSIYIKVRANRKTRNLDYFTKTVLHIRRKCKGDIWGQIGDANALSDHLYRLFWNYTHLSPEYLALHSGAETLIKHSVYKKNYL